MKPVRCRQIGKRLKARRILKNVYCLVGWVNKWNELNRNWYKCLLHGPSKVLFRDGGKVWWTLMSNYLIVYSTCWVGLEQTAVFLIHMYMCIYVWLYSVCIHHCIKFIDKFRISSYCWLDWLKIHFIHYSLRPRLHETGWPVDRVEFY